MTGIICADPRMGVSFNNRRIARETNVLMDIVQSVKGKSLHMNQYSLCMFAQAKNLQEYLKDTGGALVIRNDLLDETHPNGCYFLEREDAPRAVTQPEIFSLDTLILYIFDQNYPADVHIPNMALLPEWECVEEIQLPGYSHDIITRRTYKYVKTK